MIDTMLKRKIVQRLFSALLMLTLLGIPAYNVLVRVRPSALDWIISLFSVGFGVMVANWYANASISAQAVDELARFKERRTRRMDLVKALGGE